LNVSRHSASRSVNQTSFHSGATKMPCGLKRLAHGEPDAVVLHVDLDGVCTGALRRDPVLLDVALLLAVEDRDVVGQTLADVDEPAARVGPCAEVGGVEIPLEPSLVA